MTHAVSNPTAMACSPGAYPCMESIRMAPGAGTGCGPVGTVDRHCGRPEESHTWPGKGYGIRPPMPTETPLSWEEVKVAVLMMQERK
jgi:hypothetical protein